MEIKFQIFEKENLVIQKFAGVFSFEHYMRYTKYSMGKPNSYSIKKVLIDFRNLNFSDTPADLPDDYHDDLEKITAIRKDINKKEPARKDITLAIWVDKPLPTVVAHLFVENFPKMNYNYCSTTEGVLNILKLPERFNDLESIIDNLENTF